MRILPMRIERQQSLRPCSMASPVWRQTQMPVWLILSPHESPKLTQSQSCRCLHWDKHLFSPRVGSSCFISDLVLIMGEWYQVFLSTPQTPTAVLQSYQFDPEPGNWVYSCRADLICWAHTFAQPPDQLKPPAHDTVPHQNMFHCSNCSSNHYTTLHNILKAPVS